MYKEYTLDIDLNVLNHLGLNLYSNVPAVLSEIIANAWDADASRVNIKIEKRNEEKVIIVQDNGYGMNDADLRKKFLKVGYQRRGETGNVKDQTPNGRSVMGRKGIGKLSVFSIAQEIQVITKTNEACPIAIELNVEKIQRAIKNEQPYHPSVIDIPKEIDIGNCGTALILKRLKKRVTTYSLDKHLRQRIARRFSIFSEKFEVFIDDEKVTLNDRDYFGKLELALVYGDYKTDMFLHDKNHIIEREINTVDKESKYPVKGWIGLAKEFRALHDGADNLNKISILARGKVALEDILESFREGGLYTKYVIGELEASFLDLTEEEDIATSSRQDFIRSDHRFIDLSEFVKQELRYLSQRRALLKKEEGAKKAQEIPAIRDWYNSLRPDTKNAAKKLFGRINQIATDDRHRKTLYKHGVLAFEHLYHKEKLSQLDKLDINNLEAAVSLFSELDDIEASWYYQITEGRLDVIKKLSKDVTEDALEKIIQRHIYKHLWLLDPSWDRATETSAMEKSVTATFSTISDKITDEERKGRIDIKYKKTSGEHVIVELKRGSVITETGMLLTQVSRYKSALRKQLDLANESGSIEVVCIVGRLLRDWENDTDRQESELALKAKGIRVITYQKLIKDAELSYQLYLDNKENKGRIKKILDAIEEFDSNKDES